MPKQKRHDRRLRWGDGWVEERVIGDQQTRYVARWPELRSDGRRRWRGRTFGSLAAAEAHLRDIADKAISGRYVAPSDATVEGIVREWFDRGISGWKGSTITTYRMLITRMIVGYLGKTRAVDMTLGRAQQWIDQLGKAKLSPRTIRLAVRLVVGAFDDAIRFGIVTVNPIRGVKLPPLIDAPMQTWDDVHVRRVFTKIRTEPMWFALYRLAIATGIRPGELRVLRWSDFDLKAGTLTVRRTESKDAEGHLGIGHTTKTGSPRTIALAGSVVENLTTWRQEQRMKRVAAARWQDPDAVFTNEVGRSLHRETWQKFHRALIAELNLPAITLHGLRHTSATLELDSGTHPKVVSERLGHRSIKTTLDLYSHVSLDLQKTAAEALDTRLTRGENATTSTGS